MSTPRQDFRQALSGDAPVLAANIFDPLSARIAQLLGYSVCVLSGSVAKAASLAVPDLVLANMSDLADACRRIMRAAPVSLMVDAEDGYGGAVNVMRTVSELEAAGVSAIEIEDNAVPRKVRRGGPRPRLRRGAGRQAPGCPRRPLRPRSGDCCPHCRPQGVPAR